MHVQSLCNIYAYSGVEGRRGPLYNNGGTAAVRGILCVTENVYGGCGI